MRTETQILKAWVLCASALGMGSSLSRTATFSDANWISMNPNIRGADDMVNAAVVDDLGNLYIGGYFTVAGGVIVNHIAKWDGGSWGALGSGMNGPVQALAMRGSDLYAGAHSRRPAAFRPMASPNGTGAVGRRWARG